MKAYPLAEADDRPQGAAERAAAADAAAEQPLDVQRQRLLQQGVDALHGRLELFGGDARHQAGREVQVEAIAETETVRARASGKEMDQYRPIGSTLSLILEEMKMYLLQM